MANYIKYSTNAQTRALKMGNFWLGPVNDGKGPTSSTGYYTALNPPSGGFTIYANKTSNGPAIFQASNESQLVSITNQLGGTSFTTSAQCLNWYVTQTDKFCVNREYEGVVTNGLVLNLDAGFTPSYSTSGTTWYDLSTTVNNGTLINGATFNSSNGGNISFDGAGDYVDLNSYTMPNNFSYCVWAKRNGNGDQGTRGIVITNGVTYIDVGFSNTILFSLVLGNNVQNLIQSPNGVVASEGVWAHYVATYNRQQAKIYFNGREVASSNYTDAVYMRSSTFRIGCWDNGGFCLNGNIPIAQMYNTTLSAQEVLQNYNAQKSRFGL